MYSGPSPRNLVLSVLVHGAAIAALFNVSTPAAEPDAHLENGRPTEIRISGKLYYVAQLDGSQSGSSGSPLPNKQAAQKSKSPAEGRSGGIAAPRAASAGRSPRPARAATPTPEPSPAPAPAKASVPKPVATPAAAANPAPAPTPEKIRPVRQEARAFIPPEVHPTPLATQTLIQPLSPPNLAPPNDSAAELPRVHGPEADAQDSQALPDAGAQDSADAGASARYRDAGAGTGAAAARAGGRSAHGFVDERSPDSVQRQSGGACRATSRSRRTNRAVRRPHPARRRGPAPQAVGLRPPPAARRPPVRARTGRTAVGSGGRE